MFVNLWRERKNSSYSIPLDGKPRRVEFDELVRAVKSKVKFSKPQQLAINRIHEDENFVAHFVSRRDNELLRVSQEIGSLIKRLSDKGVGVKDQVKAYDKIAKKLRLWVDETDAFEDLRDTASLLLTLFSALTFQ